MGKKTEVLLLKPLPGKGNAGDVIDVKIHYANHYLIPEGIATIYDQQVKNQRSAQIKRIEKAKLEQLNQVKEILAILEKEGLTFIKAATDANKLYDSIDEKAIATEVHMKHKLHLDRKHFNLEDKIEAIGEYTVTFTYGDISSKFPIKVERKEE